MHEREQKSGREQKKITNKVVGAICSEKEQQRGDKGDRYEWRVEMDWSCDKTVY